MDHRTKRQKLEAMANQSISPHEAEVARKKLAELPDEEVDELYAAAKSGTSYDFAFEYDEFLKSRKDLWVRFTFGQQPRTDPKYPGEDLFSEYTWTYNFSEEKWERQG